MGVDDEYRAVASAEDSHDQLLDEKSQPISRSAYKKRSVAASILIGALIGAGTMFVVTGIFGIGSQQQKHSNNNNPNNDVAAAAIAPVATTTVTATVEIPNPAAVSATSFPNVHDVQTSASTEDEDEDIITDCGSTPDEARAKGCVFDVMSQLWEPRECYDEPLSERYLLNGNWSWWGDEEASFTLSLEEMRKGEHPVIYVIQDYHKQHCIFSWEKAVRALRNNNPIIEELISYDHVMHCKHTTLSPEAEGVRGVRAPTAYARCAKYNVWSRHMPGNKISSTD